MYRRNSHGLRAVPCILLPLLASCGGYGGMGGSMSYGTMPPPVPQAAVTFSSPMQASAIHLGQAVKLAWTSSNATSCSASASSDIGGAFSGSQPTSGSVTVAPVGTGMVTYSLSCMGAGGTGSATTAAVTVLPSVMSMMSLTTITAIGSTVDPIENGDNPYGLAIATGTGGLVSPVLPGASWVRPCNSIRAALPAPCSASPRPSTARETRSSTSTTTTPTPS